jgi:hypothetical protein
MEIPQEKQSEPASEVVASTPPLPVETGPPLPESPDMRTGIISSESTQWVPPVLTSGGEPSEKPEDVPPPALQPEPVVPAREIPETTTPKKPPTILPVPGIKKPVPAMTWVMIGIVILVILAIGAYSVGIPMLSGTGSTQKSGDTAGFTPTGTSISRGSTQSTVPLTETLTPGQTQVPPANLMVNFQAERDTLTGIVTVTFRGGEGQNGVKDVLFRLTRSDGQVLEKSFTITQIGRSESLQGTKMTDRVEVIASYYNGNQYKVLDQTFEYKKR